MHSILRKSQPQRTISAIAKWGSVAVALLGAAVTSAGLYAFLQPMVVASWIHPAPGDIQLETGMYIFCSAAVTIIIGAVTVVTNVMYLNRA